MYFHMSMMALKLKAISGLNIINLKTYVSVLSSGIGTSIAAKYPTWLEHSKKKSASLNAISKFGRAAGVFQTSTVFCLHTSF
jgi:hypothetical protein